MTSGQSYLGQDTSHCSDINLHKLSHKIFTKDALLLTGSFVAIKKRAKLFNACVLFECESIKIVQKKLKPLKA